MVWEITRSKMYKGFGSADLRILYDENILRGGEIMRSRLYKSVLWFCIEAYFIAQRRFFALKWLKFASYDTSWLQVSTQTDKIQVFASVNLL